MTRNTNFSHHAHNTCQRRVGRCALWGVVEPVAMSEAGGTFDDEDAFLVLRSRTLLRASIVLQPGSQLLLVAGSLLAGLPPRQASTRLCARLRAVQVRIACSKHAVTCSCCDCDRHSPICWPQARPPEAPCRPELSSAKQPCDLTPQSHSRSVCPTKSTRTTRFRAGCGAFVSWCELREAVTQPKRATQ